MVSSLVINEVEMALYDYKCKNCENVQEERHSINDTPVIECKECGSTDTFKYIGQRTLTVIFRGIGFTVNDHALDKMKVPQHVRENNRHTIMRD